MKIQIHSHNSQIGLLLPKHIKPESNVAAKIPPTGIVIREIVEQYSFKGFGGGGVRSRFALDCSLDVLREILVAIDLWFVSMDMRPRSQVHGPDHADSISYVLRPEFCNGGLFKGE
jgi:hypothetical protein